MMRTILTITLLGAVAAPDTGQDHRVEARAVIRETVARAYRGGEAAQRQDSREQVERTTRTLKIGANGELQLANISGDIVVTRGGGSDVSVEIVKTARGRTDDDARELLQLVQVEVVERGGRAEVKTQYPQGDEMRRNNRRNMNVSVAYTVSAPAGIRLRASSISGSITVKDIKGDVSAESVSGNVQFFNGGRITSAKSISGNVELNDTAIDGNFNASSVSGSVILRRVKARQLDLGSISGEVVLDDVDSQQVEAQTVSGNLKFGGPVTKGGRYELSSHSGNVSVALGGSTGFEVEATSFSGSIKSDFSFNSGSGDQGNTRWRKSIRGVYGDGSAVLDLTTFSGSIVITKR
jgi:phage terminase small subunit